MNLCACKTKMEEQIKNIKIEEITSKELDLLVALYENTLLRNGARFGSKGFIFTKEYEKNYADVYNMELKNGDIFVASYQRSGTTWTQELVWLIAKDLDYKMAEFVPLMHRYAFLELSSFFLYDEYIKEAIELAGNTEQVRQAMAFLATPATKTLADMPSPRFVKTHLPMSLLPPMILDTAKVVYVARDPRDLIVSSYYHGKLFRIVNPKTSLKELWNAFANNLFILTPYFEHVKEAWALRNHPNMLFLFYEDLCKDLPASIRRVSAFLGKEVTPAQMERLCDQLSIVNFKKNKSVNCEDLREIGLMDSNDTFIRKGKTGSWRDHFDEEMQRHAEQWIADNLRDSDLRFPGMEL